MITSGYTFCQKPNVGQLRDFHLGSFVYVCSTAAHLTRMPNSSWMLNTWQNNLELLSCPGPKIPKCKTCLGMLRSSDARGRTLSKACSYLQPMLQTTLFELALECPFEEPQEWGGTLPVSIKSCFNHASGQLSPGKKSARFPWPHDGPWLQHVKTMHHGLHPRSKQFVLSWVDRLSEVQDRVSDASL